MNSRLLHLSLILVVTLVSVAAVSATLRLSRFDARTSGSDIVVAWQASIETSVDAYVVERKSAYDVQFKDMERVRSHGPNKLYQFTDERVYEAQPGQETPLGEIIYYRLRVLNDDGSITVTDPISVDYTPTAIRRTWGSIKAMFQ
ncbi:MAG: hypothetical protein AAGI08_10870 [Bacteroidota bacterium]